MEMLVTDNGNPAGNGGEVRDDRIRAALQKVIDTPIESPTFGPTVLRIGQGLLESGLAGEVPLEEAAQAAVEILGTIELWFQASGRRVDSEPLAAGSVRRGRASASSAGKPDMRRVEVIAQARREWLANGDSFQRLCSAPAYVNQCLRERQLALLSNAERAGYEH